VINRRQIIKAAAAAPFVARSTVLGANDAIHVGFVGVGNRARWLLEHEDFGDARIVSIADCSSASLTAAAKVHPQGEKWNKYTDYRRMWEKEKLDAVFIETPTHARVLIALHALQSGLDVYAEKPLTLTVQEGQVLVKAVRKYKRVLQTGTQQRSMPINMYASNLVSGGKIGKIEKVIVCNFLGPDRWTPQPEQPVPEGLDWDQWCNQTPLRPYHVDLHRGWAGRGAYRPALRRVPEVCHRRGGQSRAGDHQGPSAARGHLPGFERPDSNYSWGLPHGSPGAEERRAGLDY
jgi:hypothetical protein